MSSEKNKQIKVRLHARNRNRERYDLPALLIAKPRLKKYVKPNKVGEDSVDFSDPAAVKFLNKALLDYYYGIKTWEFPDENLCPPIPGRADYIHHIADLLGENNAEEIPTGGKVTCLDVGIGASCIYPIIGVIEYGWKFIGSDIDTKSLAAAQHIIDSNASLKDKIECRLQKNARDIFKGILGEKEQIDVVICNPPFHASLEDAQKGSRRKIKNLSGKKVKTPKLNFAGISHELIYKGGEQKFIKNMIWESRKLAKNCYCYSTLVSKQSSLKGIYSLLQKIEAEHIKTISMGTGNKSTRIVAWTFLTIQERENWRRSRW